MHLSPSVKLSSQLVAVVLFGASLFRCQRGSNSAGGGAAAVRAALHSARRESGAAAAESRKTLLRVFSACGVNAKKRKRKNTHPLYFTCNSISCCKIRFTLFFLINLVRSNFDPRIFKNSSALESACVLLIKMNFFA